MPGFGLALGWTIFYLCLIILIPLSNIFVKSSSLGFRQFLLIITPPRALAAFKLNLGASLAAAFINAIFGLLVAWVLVRYSKIGIKVSYTPLGIIVALTFIGLPFVVRTIQPGAKAGATRLDGRPLP